MIHRLQEIQSIYISQNRLVEGKDYVRAEWLKKNGLARIDIPTNYNMVDSVTCCFKNYGTQSNWQVPVFGGDKAFGLLWLSYSRFDTYFPSQYYFDRTADEYNFKVRFNWQTKKRIVSLNGENIAGWISMSKRDAENTKISIGDAGMFNQSWVAHNAMIMIKYFSLAPNIYLYPCQLLQDIPATLDANGIARTAGECGMVDSISGKFYGNIASSGSFSVEGLDESGTVEDTRLPRLHQIYRNKLVEGEDYIVGEMLKGDDNSPYISIPNLQNFNLEAHRTNTNNYTLLEGTYTQYQGTTYTACINYTQQVNKSSANVTSGVFKATVTISNDVTIEKRHKVGYDALKFNGANCVRNASEPVYNGIDLRTVTKLLANANSYIVSLKGNKTYANSDEWKYTFVPCRLLRPIPRNLDAQCKSRVAGECGMIDLISGRFYGNVASSGAFSLEWDEWLKDCSIKFNPETTLGYNTSIPNDYVIYGRIEVAKLTAQYTDFGFMQASNNYIILGESTVYAISDWGTNKWATFVVSYSGGYECSLQLNGVTLTTITSSTPYNQSPHIQLHGIMQLSKIEHTYYPDESDPTQSSSEVWKRFVEEDGRQGLGISDLTYKIYAD